MPGSKQTTWKQFFASRWFMGVAVLVLLLLTLAFIRAYYQNYQIQQEIKRLQAEAARLATKKSETIDMLKYVQSPAYVEEKARTELNLKKEGEHVVIVPNSTKNGGGQSTVKMVESSRSSNLKKWWDYFFH